MHSRSTYGECIYKGIIAPRWKWKMYINVKKKKVYKCKKRNVYKCNLVYIKVVIGTTFTFTYVYIHLNTFIY